MTTPMFGCIVPGRLVQFVYQQISDAQIVFLLPNCESINHLVIFLTGSQPFPEGYAASIYLCWPNSEVAWHMLGFVSNDKPSVVFKIAKPKNSGTQMNIFDGAHPVNCNATAQVGVAIEPLNEVLQKTPTNTDISTLSSFVEFTQKMMVNAFNYCCSFAVQQSQISTNEMFIPISSLQKWYEMFQRKLEMDPNFWKSL
ncbi:protein Hikeshi [Hydra vulgaris]|uniref:Protein Hikeshi n=1 Tax=Hydra vulgaris TaxID=6087 RepID=A0ABM4D506_HYDVU